MNFFFEFLMFYGSMEFSDSYLNRDKERKIHEKKKTVAFEISLKHLVYERCVVDWWLIVSYVQHAANGLGHRNRQNYFRESQRVKMLNSWMLRHLLCYALTNGLIKPADAYARKWTVEWKGY